MLDSSSNSREELNDALAERLKVLGQELKEARKVLRRDWESLTPKERSAGSRVVKEMEEEERALLDEMEMNGVE